MKRILSFLLISLSCSAQVKDPSDCFDGLVSDSVIPYPFLREADMMWSARHWERIDIRHKMNLYLYYPVRKLPCRKSLYDAILSGIFEREEITDLFADDRFEIPLSIDQVRGYVQMIDTLADDDDASVILLVDTIRIGSKDVKFWDLKTDWYFNKSRGELSQRIIGISPVVENPKTGDRYNLFWVWFPGARKTLASYAAFNPNNGINYLNYDQALHFRLFDSVILKEDNVYDRRIEEYKRSSTLDQLLEAEQIKNRLRNQEAEIWEY